MPRWFFFTLLAVLCWGIWAVLSKGLGDSLTAVQSQALSTLGLLPVLVALGRRRGSSQTGNRRRGSLLAFLAGALTCGGNVAYYQALNVGGKASTVVPLTALYPLVTIVLAVTFLRERLNRVQLCGIGVSLIAIYLFNVPSIAGTLNPWLVYALIPISLWGASGLVQKVSTHHISGELSAFWFLAAFIPVGVGLLIFNPLVAPIAFKVWLLVIGLGLFFSLGNYAILRAFAMNGKASVIAPLAGLYPVVSVPLAIGLLGETVSPREIAGILLALISVVALSFETICTSEHPL